MSADADYHAVLADLRQRKAEIEAAIKAVEGIIALLGLKEGETRKIRGTQDLPTDAFLSLTIPEAAIKYLGMVRSAQSAAQIWEALKQGGLPHTKYAAVYNALTRRQQQAGDILKLPDSNWGLAEWYPRPPVGARRAAPRRERADRDLSESAESISVNGDGESSAQSSTILATTEPYPKLSLVDAAATLLENAGGPLHAKELVDRLNTLYGKSTNVRSLSGTLPQDGKRRFRNLGRNLWVLVEPPEK
jgi:DNA-directed RNA polymerase delta subunit